MPDVAIGERAAARLAEEDGARLFQLADNGAVFGGKLTFAIGFCAPGRACADRVEEVFQAIGNAVKGAAIFAVCAICVHGVRLGASTLRHDGDPGVEGRVNLFDPVKIDVCELARRDRARADPAGKFRKRRKGDVCRIIREVRRGFDRGGCA